MILRGYTSEGIVLTRRNFGEADRILSIYSKDHGRVSLIAKGVRRPTSRKRGHIEVFNLVKFQAVIGHGLDMMTEAEVVDDFKSIRGSLKKVSLAYYLMEVVGRITHEGESNIELFNLLSSTLIQLQTATELKSLRLDFVLKLLTLLGYWPKGVKLGDPDEKLEEVIERQIFSLRVGKIMSS
jgi:DNA repair protein RecO (recombination protein O)